MGYWEDEAHRLQERIENLESLLDYAEINGDWNEIAGLRAQIEGLQTEYQFAIHKSLVEEDQDDDYDIPNIHDDDY